MSFKQRSRERVHPKMGKLDIDYQVNLQADIEGEWSVIQ